MRFSYKLTLWVLVLLAVCFGAGGTLLIHQSWNESMERARDAALEAHRLVARTAAAVEGEGLTSYTDALSALTVREGDGGMAIRLTGEGLFSYTSGSREAFDPALRELADTEHLALQLNPLKQGGCALQISGWLETPEGSLCLETLHDVSQIYAQRDNQIRNYRWLFLAVLALGGGAAWAMAHLLTRPLRALSAAARGIAAGDFSRRVEVRAGDEIGTLAADFNRMTDRLQENIAALQESVRRQEDFHAGFAHELKTPMTSIIGYADLLRSHDLPPREAREAANYIFTEGKRMERLSLKLLDMIVMQKEGAALEPYRPGRILQELAQTVVPILKRQNITLTCRSGPGRCMLDPDLVRSLLVNLVDNARKAMDGPGKIFVEARVTPEGCVFQVTDNGRGMPQEELSRITEAFYRVDKSRSRAQGGAGLGLALCQEIARRHGGEISFASAPGQGTCVTVILRGGAA